jgi:hypothetical protein
MDRIGKIYQVLELQFISKIKSFMSCLSYLAIKLFRMQQFVSFSFGFKNDYAILNENNSNKIPVHIFTDSLNTQTTLCNNFIQKKHFSLIEDLKNITFFLTDDFDFFIHWILSHIENTSVS